MVFIWITSAENQDGSIEVRIEKEAEKSVPEAMLQEIQELFGGDAGVRFLLPEAWLPRAWPQVSEIRKVTILQETRMKISVVIPAYNEEKRLPECLDALAEGSEQPYEVIVADGNSTDRTAAIREGPGSHCDRKSKRPRRRRTERGY